MTEATGVVTALGPAEHADTERQHRLLSAGTAIPGVRVEIRDPDTGATQPVGATGEVCVHSDQLMGGYWNKPEATADRASRLT
jgi:acyl-CoA synthetase (AMP-forming)/AMP-acid ligase II